MQYLKVMLAMLLVSVLTLPAMAGLVVTPADVQIRFPDAAEPDSAWCIVNVETISYLAGPVGSHNDRAKLGIQIWEGLLQEAQPELGKVRFEITIRSMPKVAGSNQDARDMELRFRVREVKPDTIEVDGPWSDFNKATIIGKPGQPVQQ